MKNYSHHPLSGFLAGAGLEAVQDVYYGSTGEVSRDLMKWSCAADEEQLHSLCRPLIQGSKT